MVKRILTLLIFTFAAITAIGQNKSLLIENVTVIPLHINKVWENRDVIIRDGIIQNIRTHIETDTTKYEFGRIDGKGKYLIPSFADAHSHLPEKENLHSYFLMNLLNGVTTLRSMRGEHWHLEIEKSEFTPHLILSAPPISRRDSISNDEIKERFSQYKNQGFDFVKILSVKNEVIFKNIVKQSINLSLPLAGHCPSNVGIFNVCKSGVFQSMEHLGGFFRLSNLDEINKAINLSITNNVYHCPTLDWYYTGQVVEDSLRLRQGVDYLPKKLVSGWEDKIKSHYTETTEEERKQDRNKSKKSFDTRIKYLAYIYRQGGKLLLSPDASGLYSIPGFGIHTEMQHFSKAEISNFDILKAACYNLSEMLHTENEWGTIKVGAKSDMILFNANPLDKIENTKQINGIIFNGKFYSKERIESELNKKR